MKLGAPYVELAYKFREFLEERGFDSPSEFHRDIAATMGAEAPSKSEIYMVFYGARRFNGVVMAFMRERYGWKVGWRCLLPVKTLDGGMKANQLRLPGRWEMRGLK